MKRSDARAPRRQRMAAGFLIPAMAAVLSGGVSAFQTPGLSPSLLALRPAAVSERCGGAFRIAPPSPGKLLRLAPLQAKKKKKDDGKSKMAPASESVKGKKDPVKAESVAKPSSPKAKPVPTRPQQPTPFALATHCASHPCPQPPRTSAVRRDPREARI